MDGREGAGLERVPVHGGSLAVHWLNEAPSGAPVVLALHSISSNGLSWQAVADDLAGEVRVLAPDMRGRAESGDLRSRGLADHARDVLAIADHLGLERPLLAGHSMGAFAAVLAAASYPDRAAAVVMVDGGLPFPATDSSDGPDRSDIDAVLESALGPAMPRLRMSFADEGAYLAYWRSHPGLAPFLEGATAGYLAAYLLHDLAGEVGALRSSTSLECVRADWGDMVADPATASSVHALQCPAHLLWADRGLLNQPTGLYTAESIAAARLPSDIRVTELATNHYGALLEPAAVTTVGLAVRELAALAC